MRIASSSAELRSAASLRATCFSEDPPGDPSEYARQVMMHACRGPLGRCRLLLQIVKQSPSALQAYQRMKASDAWETLEAKVAGTETAFQVGQRLQCSPDAKAWSSGQTHTGDNLGRYGPCSAGHCGDLPGGVHR